MDNQTRSVPVGITDADAFFKIGEDLSGSYRLLADIDFQGGNLTPIGVSSKPFTGELDGGGFCLKNFKISSTAANTGIFGYASKASFRNLRIENAQVSSTNLYTGVLAGCADQCRIEAVCITGVTLSGGNVTGALAGLITGGSAVDCMVKGTVTGGNQTGGLSGYAIADAVLMRCCADAEVSGKSHVGGLIGQMTASLTDCYALGQAKSVTNHNYTGGIAGYGTKGSILNCFAACGASQNSRGIIGYFDGATVIEKSYFDSLARGVLLSATENAAKLTTALVRKKFFEGWDFENVWEIDEGVSYPYLRSSGRPDKTALLPKFMSSGSGTKEDPYLADYAEALELVSYEPAGCYKLAAEIDLEGRAFTPIGNSSVPFTGRCDGDGHTVKNLRINTTLTAVGFFGTTDSAEIRNLRLESAEVKTSMSYAGLLAGNMKGGRITACCASGKVSAKTHVGVLAGCADGDISDSYVMGSVTSTSGSAYAGGAVGYYAAGTMKNCYAVCQVSRGGNGIACATSASAVKDSYFDLLVAAGRSTDKYNTGKLTMSMMCRELYENWDFGTVWDIREGSSYPFLRCFGKPDEEITVPDGISGLGTEENPYLITKPEAFKYIPYDMSAYYKLACDLDLGGATVTPVGSIETPFTGCFDGDGYAVKNFKVNGRNYMGLFGYTKNAVLKRLRAEDAEISTDASYAGILVGYVKEGSVSECCATGSIKGKAYIGGLIGSATGAQARDCHASAIVEPISNGRAIGGLLGFTDTSTIENCYAACRVGKGGYGFAYVYTSAPGTTTSSYFDSLSEPDAVSDSWNRGKLTGPLVRKDFFKDWDFETIWDITDGEAYPRLRCMRTVKEITPAPYPAVSGFGTPESPYLVDRAETLALIKHEFSGCYKLVCDLDLTGAAVSPIGSDTAPFTGVFDGDGYAVSNFSVASAANYTGLFGYVKEGEIKNLKIRDAEILQTGIGYFTGALAGSLDHSSVEFCGADRVTVSGTEYTGGLAGRVYGGSVKSCFFGESCSVSGTSLVGGLVGLASSPAKVSLCCSAASVLGDSYTGGLIGELETEACDCCCTGNVTSRSENSYTGGLIGFANKASVRNCYASCAVSKNGSGLIYVHASTPVTNSYFNSDLTGVSEPAAQARTSAQLLQKETFAGWDWEDIWQQKEGAYPHLRSLELIVREPFDLGFHSLTGFSAAITWPQIEGAGEYELLYQDQRITSQEVEIAVTGLLPDTEYTFHVRANLGAALWLSSKPLKIRTRALFLNGSHGAGKSDDSAALTWEPAEDAAGYEIRYNGELAKTDTNAFTLGGLSQDTPYVVRIKALLEGGAVQTSAPFMINLYTLDPQTEYASEFIEKCEGQTWFLDEMQNLLWLRGKSLNTIASVSDFDTVYGIELTGRGINGRIPAAIGELRKLKYLYLANNNLSGPLPEELDSLNELIEMDLSGNHFTENKEDN